MEPGPHQSGGRGAGRLQPSGCSHGAGRHRRPDSHPLDNKQGGQEKHRTHQQALGCHKANGGRKLQRIYPDHHTPGPCLEASERLPRHAAGYHRAYEYHHRDLGGSGQGDRGTRTGAAQGTGGTQEEAAVHPECVAPDRCAAECHQRSCKCAAEQHLDGQPGRNNRRRERGIPQDFRDDEAQRHHAAPLDAHALRQLGRATGRQRPLSHERCGGVQRPGAGLHQPHADDISTRRDCPRIRAAGHHENQNQPSLSRAHDTRAAPQCRQAHRRQGHQGSHHADDRLRTIHHRGQGPRPAGGHPRTHLRAFHEGRQPAERPRPWPASLQRPCCKSGRQVLC